VSPGEPAAPEGFGSGSRYYPNTAVIAKTRRVGGYLRTMTGADAGTGKPIPA